MGRNARFALVLVGSALAVPLFATSPGRILGARLLDAAGVAFAWLLARDLVGDRASPGLLLVLGGVLVMGAVAIAALFASALQPTLEDAPKPRRVHTTTRVADAGAPDAYRGPRDLEFERGRAAGSRVDAAGLDAVLDRMVEMELGEPRVERSLPSFLKLRLHGCRGCGRQGASGPVEGCAFECGFLESALTRALGRSAVAHEVRCRTAGAPACEFEVWF